MSRKPNVYDEPETDRLLGLSERQSPEQRREEKWWDDTLTRMDNQRVEDAADRIEELSAGWEDPLTGFPYPGFESPRFVSEEKARYRDWYRNSPDAAHIRRIREGR